MGTLLQLVHPDLIAGYERKHPEAGSLVGAYERVAVLDRKLGRLVRFAFDYALIAALGSGIVLTRWHMSLIESFILLVGVAIVPILILSQKHGSLSRQREQARGFTRSFERALALFYPRTAQEQWWICDAQYAHTSLLGCAVTVLCTQDELAQARARGAPLGDRLPLALKEVGEKNEFEAIFEAITDDFGLLFDKRKLFAEARKAIDRSEAV